MRLSFSLLLTCTNTNHWRKRKDNIVWFEIFVWVPGKLRRHFIFPLPKLRYWGREREDVKGLKKTLKPPLLHRKVFWLGKSCCSLAEPLCPLNTFWQKHSVTQLQTVQEPKWDGRQHRGLKTLSWVVKLRLKTLVNMEWVKAMLLKCCAGSVIG